MNRQDFIKVLLERSVSSLEDYDDISYAFDNLYLARNKNNNLYGLIEPNYGEKIPCNYKKQEFLELINEKQKDDISNSTYLKMVTKDCLKGFVDDFSNVVIPFMYEKALPFSENLAAVRNNQRKWGFINEDNVTIIPFLYDQAKSFKEGLAPVKKDEKWGFIDKLGNIKVPFVLDLANEFKKGYSLIVFNGQEYFMNSDLKLLKNIVSDCKYLKDFKELPEDTKEYEILEYVGLLEFDSENVIIREKRFKEYISSINEIENYKLDSCLGEFSKTLKKIK